MKSNNTLSLNKYSRIPDIHIKVEHITTCVQYADIFTDQSTNKRMFVLLPT